jgi:hypothetical protein
MIVNYELLRIRKEKFVTYFMSHMCICLCDRGTRVVSAKIASIRARDSTPICPNTKQQNSVHCTENFTALCEFLHAASPSFLDKNNLLCPCSHTPSGTGNWRALIQYSVKWRALVSMILYSSRCTKHE